jgi:hypothetical protein
MRYALRLLAAMGCILALQQIASADPRQLNGAWRVELTALSGCMQPSGSYTLQATGGMLTGRNGATGRISDSTVRWSAPGIMAGAQFTCAGTVRGGEGSGSCSSLKGCRYAFSMRRS